MQRRELRVAMDVRVVDHCTASLCNAYKSRCSWNGPRSVVALSGDEPLPGGPLLPWCC